MYSTIKSNTNHSHNLDRRAANHGISRDDRSQLLLRPSIGSLWSRRQNNVPEVCGAIVYADLDMLGDLETEPVRQSAARIADNTSPVAAGFVPV